MASGGWLEELEGDLMKESTAVTEPTIFRPPAALRLISPDHFQPRTFHLGLHNRKPYSATGSEELKVAVARALLQKKASPKGTVQNWKDVVSQVVSSPQDARKEYEVWAHGDSPGAGYLDVTALADDAVAYMLTLDAVFVVAFLQVSGGSPCEILWTDIFREQPLMGLSSQLPTELGMLQNQVPLSCLKGAVQVILEATPESTEKPKKPLREELEDLLRHAVCLLYPLKYAEDSLKDFIATTYTGENSLANCKHILDCVYRVLSETLYREGSPGKGVVHLHGPPEERSNETILTVDHDEDTARLVVNGGPLNMESGSTIRNSEGRSWIKSLSSKANACRTLLVRLIPFLKGPKQVPQTVQGPKQVPQTVQGPKQVPQLGGPVMSAMKLKLCGIEIESAECRLSGIRYKNRRCWNALLLLPQLALYDTTAGELRNLAEYEFLAYPSHGHIRKYMRFMNDLVTSVADAELVVRSGAITSYVGGADEVVRIWSGLNQGITLPFSYADKPTHVEKAEEAIRRHCRKVRRLCCADIRSELCGRPTLFFSALFAFLLLAFTIAQTTASFLSLKHVWY